MANTIGTQGSMSFVWRHKYFKSNLEVALRNALISEKVCRVDRTEMRSIENPYLTNQAATIQSLKGTYSVSTLTTAEDSLDVNDEVIVSAHLFDFEKTMSNFDLMASFYDDLTYSVAFKIDQFVMNKVLDIASGAYTTPAGGFTTAANIPVICSNLISKVAGYQSGTAEGLFLVIENTDVVGFAQAQVASGFSYADAALNNGFMSNYMGIDIYVVRSGTFTTATLGTLSATNSGHRLFGVRGVPLFAAPRGVQYEEKYVTGKTGKEVVVYGYIGAYLWTPKASLCVDITLA